MAITYKALEVILVERSWISGHDLKRARQYREPGQSLADSLAEIRAVEPRRLARALAEAYCLPFQTHLHEGAIDGQLIARIGISYARKNRILPLGTDGANMVVAAADPSKYEPLDDLGVLFGMPVQPVVVPFDVLDRVIERTCQRSTATPAVGPIISLEEQQLETVASQLDRMPLDLLGAETPLVIRLVNALLRKAVDDRASDIQIEPFERELLVRFRADGTLYDVMSSPLCLERALTSRLKVMAGLTVAERQIPQNGHVRLRIAGSVIAVPMSTMPGAFGERIALRLPDSGHELVDIIIDECVDALQGLATEVTAVSRPTLCWQCGELIVVVSALFCKDCGAKLGDTHRSSGGGSQPCLAPGSLTSSVSTP
jgi:general secretion pathway protein E